MEGTVGHVDHRVAVADGNDQAVAQEERPPVKGDYYGPVAELDHLARHAWGC